jgi:hypothetical protein
MPRGKSTYRKRDLDIALDSTRKAGMVAIKIEIYACGKICITAIESPTSADPAEAPATGWEDYIEHT